MQLLLVYTILVANVKSNIRVFECYEVDSVPVPEAQIIPAFPQEFSPGAWIFEVIVDTNGKVFRYVPVSPVNSYILKTFDEFKDLIHFIPGIKSGQKVFVKTNYTLTLGENTPRFKASCVKMDSLKLLLTFKDGKLIKFRDFYNTFCKKEEVEAFLKNIDFNIKLKEKDTLRVFLYYNKVIER